MRRLVETVASRRTVILWGGVATLASVAPARGHHAQVMLTITEPSGRVRQLREQDIAALPWRRIATRTRWTEGVQVFRGPLLRDVLTSGGLTQSDLAGRNLLMKALNDFGTVVPADDAWSYDPVLAREMNGKPMRVRDKGPLWLVYPRDQRPELQSAVRDERWIWQLFEITVL
ncbi:molybdopterin-dependent oxidoreductase [Paracoccus thiocyanatus]|uniref:Oxidoreductase molybdopterin-binding domain-containing protein n=1 Tax=Paracoccus thiocyanatus TaxID=34006 RepID=A0A3D8P8T1_9RHOB|nr:molybdopterin-dependent oxidoreductase [Paracoccus thiocyanatus]RDW12453.1 hypothetical protein DIE28_13510 [Paracoccus thiocyanatus]